ncbi:MAG: sialidase family protein [Gemmatimonadota bacterium]
MATVSRAAMISGLGAMIAGCGGSGAEEQGAPVFPVRAAVESLPSPAGPRSGEPNLFATGDRIYLSWIEAVEEAASPNESDTTRDPEDPVHALRFAAWDGETWSEPGTIAAGRGWFVNWADFPSLVALPDGSLAAHWLVRTGPETYAYEVRIARSPDGGRTWSGPIVPHDDGTPTEHGFVSLFPGSRGGLGAVWLDGRKFAAASSRQGAPPPGSGTGPGTGGAEAPSEDEDYAPGAEMTLRAAVIGAEGEVGDDALLDGRACDCCQTAAAMTSRGPVVAYRDRSADEIRDIAVVRLVDGRWTEPRPLHADGWVISACPVNGPAIAARDAEVAVAWFTAARDTLQVRIAFSGDAGATFGPPGRVDEGAPLGRVDVELLEDGSALVTWLEGQHSETRILARRIASGGQAGPAVFVAPASPERASGFPRAAVLGNRVVFAWTEPGDPSRIRLAIAFLEDFLLSDGSGRPAAEPDAHRAP